MVGEVSKAADDNASLAPSDKPVVDSVEKSVTDILQHNSMWQTTALFPQKHSEQICPPTSEERENLLEKFGTTLDSQVKHAKDEAWGRMLIGASLLGSNVYAPLRIGVGSAGVVMSFYNSIQRQSSEKEAVRTLSSMPKIDAERFGKYQHSMQFATDTTGGAYVAAGGTAGLWAVGLVKSANPVTLVGLGALGVEGSNSAYVRPKAASSFRSDFDAWKAQMKK